jgi:hypothetical protein
MKADVLKQGKLKILNKAFDTFDQQNNGTVDGKPLFYDSKVREIGTILRSLGIYPSLEQLHLWVTEVYMIFDA